MADRPAYPDTGDDTGVGPERESPPGMPRWLKVSGLIAGVLVLLVVGLMFIGGHEGGPGPGGHGPGRHTAGGGGESGDGAAFDRQFIDMMVPHHQGAVEMAKVAQQRAEHPEIKEMAAAVIRTQEAEINKMKAWRKSWFGSDQTPPMTEMPMVPGVGGHGGAGAKMNMAADVDKLRAAPAPFDKAFIEAMIPHHESAIEAAKAAATRAEKPEIKELARAIIADQQREIDQMKQWRQAWYGTTSRGTTTGEQLLRS